MLWHTNGELSVESKAIPADFFFKIWIVPLAARWQKDDIYPATSLYEKPCLGNFKKSEVTGISLQFPDIFFSREHTQMLFCWPWTESVCIQNVCSLCFIHMLFQRLEIQSESLRMCLVLKLCSNERKGEVSHPELADCSCSVSTNIFIKYYLPSMSSSPPHVNSCQPPQTLISAPLGLWECNDSDPLKQNTTSLRSSCFFSLEQQPSSKQ